MLSGERFTADYTHRFPDGQALADRLSAAGLVDVTYRPMTFGVATLYVGHKPASSGAAKTDHSADPE